MKNQPTQKMDEGDNERPETKIRRMSDLERSMSTMQWDMGEVKETLNKVTSSLVKRT